MSSHLVYKMGGRAHLVIVQHQTVRLLSEWLHFIVLQNEGDQVELFKKTTSCLFALLHACEAKKYRQESKDMKVSKKKTGACP